MRTRGQFGHQAGADPGDPLPTMLAMHITRRPAVRHGASVGNPSLKGLPRRRDGRDRWETGLVREDHKRLRENNGPRFPNVPASLMVRGLAHSSQLTLDDVDHQLAHGLRAKHGQHPEATVAPALSVAEEARRGKVGAPSARDRTASRPAPGHAQHNRGARRDGKPPEDRGRRSTRDARRTDEHVNDTTGWRASAQLCPQKL